MNYSIKKLFVFLFLSFFAIILVACKNSDVFFTVTFDANGGTLTGEATVEVKKDAKLIAPDAPTRDFYVFTKWYKDQNCTLEYGFDSVVTKDFILYAGWKDEELEMESVSTIDEFLNMELDGTYILKNDLDLKGEKITPIGSYKQAFTGVFDGNGYSIKNFSFEDAEYMALFAVLEGTLKNLNVEGITAASNGRTGATYLGGLVAYNRGGTISSCSASGDLSADSKSLLLTVYLGGIAGRNDAGIIENCYVDVNLTGSNDANVYIGGIAGYNGGGKNYEGKIRNCVVTGEKFEALARLNTGSAYVGGITGYNFGYVGGSYSMVELLKSVTWEYYNSVAGIVADNNGGFIENCFTTSNITVETYHGNTFLGSVVARLFIGGEVSNSYAFDGQVINTIVTDEAYWGLGRHYRYISPLVTKEELADSSWYQDVLKLTETFSFVDGKYPSILGEETTVELTCPEGTYGNPIKIRSVEDFQNIDVTKSYILENDIDLTDVDFVPIGSYEHPFYGLFDGNGFKISGLMISEDKNLGMNSLFGHFNGMIRNLSVETEINYQSETAYPQYVSGLAAFGIQGIIEKSHAEVLIDVENPGIIGAGLLAYGDDVKVIESSTTGTINLKSLNESAYAGGLVGVTEAGLIESSYSKANVTIYGNNTVNVGGLIGKNTGNIIDCYSTGKITGNVSADTTSSHIYIGGLIANNETGLVKNSYSKSKMIVSSKYAVIVRGGFAGYNNGTVENCYWYQVYEEMNSFGHSIIPTDVTPITNISDAENLSERLGNETWKDVNDSFPVFRWQN